MYALKFSEPEQVKTQKGTYYVRQAAPTDQFWKAWRENKDEVKAAVFVLTKYHDEWVVSFWSGDEKCVLPLT